MATSTTETPIRLRSSSDIALAAPLMLGYWPGDSVCAVCVDEWGHVVLVMRWDRADTPVLPDLSGPARHSGAVVACHVVVYAEPGACDTRPWHVDAETLRGAGLDVTSICQVQALDGQVRWRVEALPSPDGRARVPAHSYAEGTVTRAGIAEKARSWGLPVFHGSRDDYVSDILPIPQAMAQVATVLEGATADVEGRRAGIVDAVLERLGRASLTETDIAEVLVALDDIQVRDTVLWDVMQGDPPSWRVAADRLAKIVSSAPQAHVAAAATLLAILRWQLGDGSRASAAVDRAREADPEYSLALLVTGCLAAGMHPATWREGLAGLRRSDCLRST